MKNIIILANSNETKSKDRNAGAEILIAIPNDLGSKKFTTYVGLVDSGASSSLLNQALIEQTAFEKTLQANTMTWETHTRQCETTGKITLANYCLPHFTMIYELTSTFHMFKKMPDDRYDFVWDAISFKNWNLIFATVQKHFYGIVCLLTWFHTVFGQQEQSPIIGTQNIRAKEINAMPSRILSLLSLTVNTAIDIADEFHFLVLVVF
jgi:hypothetical protein